MPHHIPWVKLMSFYSNSWAEIWHLVSWKGRFFCLFSFTNGNRQFRETAMQNHHLKLQPDTWEHVENISEGLWVSGRLSSWSFCYLEIAINFEVLVFFPMLFKKKIFAIKISSICLTYVTINPPCQIQLSNMLFYAIWIFCFPFS